MAGPTVIFYQYSAVSTTNTALNPGAGDVVAWKTITSGAWSKDVALKIRWQNTAAFTLSNTRLWVNKTAAIHTSTTSLKGTEIDIGKNYPGTPDFWSIKYLYTAGSGNSAMTDVQSAKLALTCPADCLTTGDTWDAGNVLATAFRPGQDASDGVDLQLSAGVSSVVSAGVNYLYSKHIGISLRPNDDAINGTYSQIGIQVTYDFS